MNRDTLLGVFEDLARRDGDFLVYDGHLRVHRYTYLQLATAARAFASRLESAGIAKGEKVVLWGEIGLSGGCLWGCCCRARHCGPR